MIDVVFVTANGDRIPAHGEAGVPLLELAQAAGLPLEGTCEGQMACSTCHVIVGREWFMRLPAATDDEEEMLDLAASVTATSRLACQVTLTDALDGLEVRIPELSRDMQLS